MNQKEKELKENPLVSVIMGIYNCQDTLSQAIESIILQTYDCWELIMCDDGSTDDTYKIALEYTIKYKNIKLLKNKKNMRLAYSLNRCLKVAKGEYIARMDSDDISIRERLQCQVDFMKKNSEYSVVGSSVLLYENNTKNGIRSPKEKPDKYNLLTNPPFIHPTIMMRKEVYDALGGYTVSKETMRAEDLDLWFRFFEKGYRGYNMQKPLLYYHESFEDLKKRSIKAAWGIFIINLKGYKRLGFSKWKYFYALKPLFAAFMPNKLMYIYHHR